MLISVKAKLDKRNRAGLSFDKNVRLVEVTPEQKQLIEQDDFLVIVSEEAKQPVEEKKAPVKTARKQTK